MSVARFFLCGGHVARALGAWRQLISLSATHGIATTRARSLTWVRRHYERVVLAVALLFLLCTTTLVLRNVLQFRDDLSHARTAPPPRPVLPLAKVSELEKAIATLEQPSQWTFSGPSGLFVPEKHFIGTNGFPTTLRVTQVHPPVPNEWWEEFALPVLDADVLLQDPDGDGFTNLEEWENHTNPTERESHPSFVAKLKMKSFSEEPFRLVFSSRVGDTFAINTNDLKEPTQFLRLGDSIRGTKFKLATFREKYEPNSYGTKIDISELVLEDVQTRQQLNLVKEKTMTSPEPVAHFVYSWGGQREFAVRKEQQFVLKPEEQIKYRLIDVQPAKAVIVNTRRPNELIEIGLFNP